MKKSISGTRVLKVILITPAALMLLSVLLTAIDIIAATGASASSPASRISILREEKAQYERQKKEISERIETLEFERLAELDKKEILDERMIVTGMEIESLSEIISQYNLLISEKEYEVIIAQNREEEQLERYKTRVRYLEENEAFSYLEIIFDATSITDLLARVDFVSSIIDADRNAYSLLQEARETTTAARDELEMTIEELGEELIKMDNLKEELDGQLKESYALIAKMEADIETERLLYEMVTEEEARVQKEIYAYEAELRRQRELERQRQLEQQKLEQQKLEQQQQQTGQQPDAQQPGSSGGSSSGAAEATGTGELMWPLSGQVISNYGMRSGRMHQGVDIGAPHGTPIVAADGGTVITSAYGSGYGNYVVVSHGNGMTTVYAHLSSRSVNKGDSVTKGQQVGLVGSTGNATCPHLHFEVSIDGNRVNPLTKL